MEHRVIHELLGQQALLFIVLQLVWEVKTSLEDDKARTRARSMASSRLWKEASVSQASAQCNHVEHHNRDEHDVAVCSNPQCRRGSEHLCRCRRDVVGIVMQQLATSSSIRVTRSSEVATQISRICDVRLATPLCCSAACNLQSASTASM